MFGRLRWVECIGSLSVRRRPADTQFDLTAATALASGCAVLGARLASLAARRRGDRKADALIVGGVCVCAWGAIASAERRRPHRPDWVHDDGEAATDLVFAFVVGPPMAALSAAIATIGGRFCVQRWPSRSGPPWPVRMPLEGRVALAMLLSELVHYWHHRASHEIPWLWRYHSVHHSAARMWWANSLRFHPVDHVPLMTSQTLLLLAIGMDHDTLVGYSILRGIHGQLQHANLSGSAPAVGWVFSTAEQHRWHHARGVDAANHGSVLSVWDRVFGTFVDPVAQGEPAELGLSESEGPRSPAARRNDQLTLATRSNRRAPSR